MSADDLIGQELTEKLAKLNSSQQSIESLSRWCINHRTKGKLIVETWDKMFKSAQREQRISFLYLANDILQNSRRKGSDFVNEFWKFLPAALKLVCENGNENGRKVASRLVDIWEERKVFGSRGQNLKEEVLGKSNLPVSVNGKSPTPIKIMKRDAQSLRIKLAVGGLPEKIISAFLLVLDENVSEESAVKKCDFAISLVNEMEKDVENSSISGSGFELADKIQEEENSLRHCVDQLQNNESIRTALVSQLKEALQDQESKLGMIREKVEIAKSQIEKAGYLKEKLKSSPTLAPVSVAAYPVTAMKAADANFSSANSTSSPSAQPSSTKLSEEESKKAAAAAVVAKLAASTSSAQMLTSVLSSLVAEEAASRSSGLNIPGFSSMLPFGSPGKRIKLDNPAVVSFSDVNHTESSYFTSSQGQAVSNVPVESSSVGMQSSFSQPPPPPPPSVPPQQNSPANQLGQSAAMLMAGLSYGYGASNLPPHLSSHVQMGYARPASLPNQQPQQLQHLQPPQQSQQQQQQPQQQQQQQQPQQQQQQQQNQLQPPHNGPYYRPPGVGFYGQSHQAATSPVPRQ